MTFTLANATPMELTWTVLGILSIIGAVRFAIDISLDLRAIQIAGVGNGRRTLAKEGVREAVVLASITVLFTAAGVVALLAPSPSQGTYRTLILAFLIIGHLLLMLYVALVNRSRKRVIESVRVKHVGSVPNPDGHSIREVEAFAPDSPDDVIEDKNPPAREPN